MPAGLVSAAVVRIGDEVAGMPDWLGPDVAGVLEEDGADVKSRSCPAPVDGRTGSLLYPCACRIL